MQKIYHLLPEEILKGKNLKNPRYVKSKVKRESEFVEFSSAYNIILMGIITLLTPNNNRVRKKELTYKDISDACGTPISTLKKYMPVIRHNFAHYFNIIERKFGRSYSYKLNPNFAKELIIAYEYYTKLQK